MADSLQVRQLLGGELGEGDPKFHLELGCVLSRLNQMVHIVVCDQRSRFHHVMVLNEHVGECGSYVFNVVWVEFN